MLGSIAAQVRSEHAQTGRRPLGQVRIQVRRHVPWSGSERWRFLFPHVMNLVRTS